MNWLQWIVFGLEIAPKVLQLIKEIEALIGPGRGELKKQLVMNSVHSTLLASGEAKKAADPALEAVGKMVDVQVDLLNQAGVFKKSE